MLFIPIHEGKGTGTALRGTHGRPWDSAGGGGSGDAGGPRVAVPRVEGTERCGKGPRCPPPPPTAAVIQQCGRRGRWGREEEEVGMRLGVPWARGPSGVPMEVGWGVRTLVMLGGAAGPSRHPTARLAGREEDAFLHLRSLSRGCSARRNGAEVLSCPPPSPTLCPPPPAEPQSPRPPCRPRCAAVPPAAPTPRCEPGETLP